VASLALQRAFFPKTPWRGVIAIVAAGIVADLDWFSATLGPASYLRWHRTALHSLGFALLVAVALFFFFNVKKQAASWQGLSFWALASASVLHLALDACQSEGVALLWPFSSRRFAFDVLPYLEPWLLAILAAAILLPELLRLVGEEIGARNKAPRGRNGAVTGLLFAALYIGARFLFHANAVASLQSHTIAGETPHRAATLPDAISPFLWHSIVETESTLNLVVVRSAGGEVTTASGITTWHKPEPSPTLSVAQNSPAALMFVKFARFPKATVEKETEGYSVEIQDLKNVALDEKSRAVIADINLDKNGNLISSELQWQNSPRPK
jgi:membrane-bound metal-dependent hydrolase YbcI (DUF457 family)